MPLFPIDQTAPEQRFKLIAAILAKGVIRCNRQLRTVISTPEKDSSESSREGLEVPGKTRLSVSRVAVVTRRGTHTR